MSKPYWERLAEIKRKAVDNQKDGLNVTVLTPDQLNTAQLGTGGNNKLEPSKPAAIDYSSGQPVVLHEGEQVVDKGQQREVRPTMQGLKMLNTEEQQQAGKQLQQQGAPGMQSGGQIEELPNMNTNRSNQMGGQRPVPRGGTPQKSKNISYGQRGINNQLQAPSSTLPSDTEQNRPTKITDQNAQNFYDVSDTINKMEKQQDEQTGSAYLQGKPKIQRAEGAMYKGLENLRQLSEGESPVYDRAREEAMAKTGAAQSAEEAAQQQKMAQADVSQAKADLLDQDLARTQAQERGQIESGLAQQEAQAAAEAGVQMQNAGQQAAQYEQSKQQDKYQKDMQQMQTLLEAGGTENIKKAEGIANKVYGKDISFKNARAKEVEEKMKDLGGLIKSGAEDMSDETVQNLADKYGKMWKQKNALKGLEFTDEEIQSVKDSMAGYAEGDEGLDTEAMNITEEIATWWEEGEGWPLHAQMNGDVKQLKYDMEDPDLSDEERERAAQQYGEVIGSAYYAQSGHDLSEQQKQQLENAGLGHMVTTEEEKQSEKEEAINQEFMLGARDDSANLIKRYKNGKISEEDFNVAAKETIKNKFTGKVDWSDGKGWSRHIQKLKELEGKDYVWDNNKLYKIGGRDKFHYGHTYYYKYNLYNVKTGEKKRINSRDYEA